MSIELAEIQQALREEGVDGWLFFDHHQRDPLAYRILKLKPDAIVSRRWYYFIPANGEAKGLVHQVESHSLDSLPGTLKSYSSWADQVESVRSLVAGCKRIAMQYSPDCAIPYVSLVDGGTIDLIRSFGVEIASSANLIQYFEARWNQEQLESHLEAGKHVDRIRSQAFERIGERLRASESATEWDIQQFILQRFAEEALFTDHGPNVSVNANASNPHYEPQSDRCSTIKAGDTVLIDLWAKFAGENSVYYDITWTGYCGHTPPTALENVFGIVREARDRAIRRVQDAVSSGLELRGFEVDDAARGFIRECGFGQYFFHRTGHSIGAEVHGTGANMDNLETHDERKVIPWTCFSIEPGIYLPEFGVRLEVNVFVDEKQARVTGEIQTHLVLI
ncbi:MAG TPA: M24 family metallopeptidase [Bryobacteraceae bacterium]|nr:M24 family metallopeptidase [Bryobacteraceae bacterium]